MAGCSFSLKFNTTPTALFSSARDALAAQGGLLTGDSQAGAGSLPTDAGTVYWSFRVVGQVLQVTVTDKPWVVACADIQREMATMVADTPKDVVVTTGEPTTTAATSPSPTYKTVVLPTTTLYAAPTRPYALYFVGGTLALVALFWSARRFGWLS